MFFDIQFPKKHTDSDTLTEKLEHVWSCLRTLSKPWENFTFSTISSIRNMSQHKAQLTHLKKKSIGHLFLCGFNWWRINWRYGEKKKIWPLTIDHSGDNEDSLSFFIFSYLQWNMITTKLTSKCKYFHPALLDRVVNISTGSSLYTPLQHSTAVYNTAT